MHGGDAHLPAVEHRWIDTPDGAAFASFHAPRAGEARGRVAILCNPFGFEATCAHRAYRHLAARLAAAGVAALRFDYPGTGDSSGDEREGDRVASWIEGACRAIAWAKERSGASDAALFGARLGALVALEAAARSNVDSVALVAPAATGRAWLREARAFQKLKPHGSAPTDEGEEIVGFYVNAATAGAIGKLDPASIGRVPARALVVARDDLPGNEATLAAALTRRGSTVTTSRAAGYAAMATDDPYKSVVPSTIWNEVVAWIAEGTNRGVSSNGAHPAGDSAKTRAVVRGDRGSPEVSEQIAMISDIFAIVTEPIDAGPHHGRPAILLHTIGANHRAGNHRLYVGLARHWAARGFRVVRFDASGMGDSPPRSGGRESYVYSPHGTEDSRHVMDELARTGAADRFVLVGLCSGAYVAFHAAVADARVVGLVMMNVLTFHWREGDSLEQRARNSYKSTRHYQESALDLETWTRLVQGDVNAIGIAKTLARRAFARVQRRVREAVAQESDVASGFRTILRRKASVLLVYGSEDGGIDLIEEHLGPNAERFRREARFHFEVLADTDHTFTPLAARGKLVDRMTSFLESEFPIGGPPSRAMPIGEGERAR